MSTTDSLQTLKHSDNEISSFLQNINGLNVDSSYYLTVLVGKNKSAKKDFLKKVKKQTDDQLLEIDLREIICSNPEQSRQRIDQMIQTLGSEKNIWLHNGDQLGGVYTGYSYSVKRYATPQERFFLKKIAETDKTFFLDLEDIHTVTSYMKRYAHTLITFEFPDSLLGRLKQFTLHGHTFSSKRKAVI